MYLAGLGLLVAGAAALGSLPLRLEQLVIARKFRLN